ncbi:thiamine phosphate synthase [Auritidibacter ignavus]|uniref:thiamine phosphate synthase n=1 Tax=Auritidibacter ignavus TaxID=678932 RepID=UPI002446EE28|nr:thiamine phosphate synthase [Auritidibacter ignavus]WGH84673.1 thiamine phosphate synthase [Auritidibacter ignavus]WGH86986.1 thiamine phosphate synthase [Auritidibacter ignavus]WGH89269.1 thiamine phosphate synthase [Auritidibacter ignavus]WHS27663.1 thiamine phosphate synthase [Auritidibacter ignavus]WHS34586.1 thiamine phosphate synthase [Auritidibacter ignavus]
MLRHSTHLADATDWRLYYITDTEYSGGLTAVPDVVVEAVKGGAGVVQVRDKTLSDEEFAELTVACQHAVRNQLGQQRFEQVRFFVNDRLDVARQLGCHLHLGQTDTPISEARAVLGEEVMIGLSTSTPRQVREAVNHQLADVLGIGPFAVTPTKPDAATPLGLTGISQCVQATAGSKVKCVAIGGINTTNAADIYRRTGVDGICVVSAIAAASDPAQVAAQLFSALHRE